MDNERFIYTHVFPIVMASITKELLKKMVDEGFFNSLKTIDQVVTRLDQKGYALKGKQVSLLSQLLTFLCQEDILERHKDENGRFKYIRLGGNADAS